MSFYIVRPPDLSKKAQAPDEVLELKERFCRLWNALNGLPETQGRRVDAHFILGMTCREIAQAEGVDKSAVRRSVLSGIKEDVHAVRRLIKKPLCGGKIIMRQNRI